MCILGQRTREFHILFTFLAFFLETSNTHEWLKDTVELFITSLERKRYILFIALAFEQSLNILMQC